jgi:DNA replication and repair protein RecF
VRIKAVELHNFRNYQSCHTELTAGRNILIGANAQGKTNFLEAIELVATGKAARADSDLELMLFQSEEMYANLWFESGGRPETLGISLRKPGGAREGHSEGRLEKRIKINGLTQNSIKGLLGRLLVVSFKSHDLNLLRGGPKFRRDWIDSLILKIRPGFHEVLSHYQKTVAQRNRLLKTLSEKGKVTVSDQDQLLAWDRQLARHGTKIIKQRLTMLAELLPFAQARQNELSREAELLTVAYLFRAPDRDGGFDDEQDQEGARHLGSAPLNAKQLLAMEEAELAEVMLKLLKERRYEEIRRRQTLLGPHRDDLIICLNGANAHSFASQGQQRSIVLSLKLAELARVKESANEPPVLLLDDVLAELDEVRQGLLMSAVGKDMQTVITTTHLSHFDPAWLEGAAIFAVNQGQVSPAPAFVG